MKPLDKRFDKWAAAMIRLACLSGADNIGSPNWRTSTFPIPARLLENHLFQLTRSSNANHQTIEARESD